MTEPARTMVRKNNLVTALVLVLMAVAFWPAFRILLEGRF